jgi:hypothetical protein
MRRIAAVAVSATLAVAPGVALATSAGSKPKGSHPTCSKKPYTLQHAKCKSHKKHKKHK